MTTSQPSAARCQAPGAEMSPATIPASGSAARSTPTTSTSSSRSRPAILAPMNPAAPVISTRFKPRAALVPADLVAGVELAPEVPAGLAAGADVCHQRADPALLGLEESVEALLVGPLVDDHDL